MENKSINDHIAKFRATNNLWFLVKAVTLVLKQSRTRELIYGGYCNLFNRPSLVTNNCQTFLQPVNEIVGSHELWFSKRQLIESFGEAFNVHSLPDDFELARSESVVHNLDCLIVGEYAENSARIAYITPQTCFVTGFYNHIYGVRHIHSIIKYNHPGEFLVSTGDTCKFLDLWVEADNKLNFAKRIKKQFAGYTASIRINNRYYFGTDFSNRPNYIETLEGNKYFYPELAYKLVVIAFYSFLDRYLVSINSNMPQFGDIKTLSIFDTFKEEFIFCDHLESL